MRSHHSVLQAALSLALLAGIAVAEPQVGVADVNVQLAGSVISVDPRKPYLAGSLSVVGPDSFEARGRFGGGTMLLDLELDKRALPPDRARDGATGVAGGVPDGRYRWEARFWVSPGIDQVASGSFTVVGGLIASPGDARQRPARGPHPPDGSMRPLTVDTLGAFDIGAESTTVEDHLFIRDVANDKLVSIQLALGNSSDGYDFRFWDVVNHDGLFRIDWDTNFIPPGATRLSIAEAGNVGINTTTAPKRLTIHTTTVNDGIRLINDNISPGFETTWDFSVDAFAGLNIQDVETGNSVMRLREGAPTDSLVITASGDVGLGTASPSANLHVTGSGRIDGDVALGSSRSLKTAFDQVDTTELLSRVTDLPLASWRYKREGEEKRHIGPFAEDFQRLFGLGDGETISVIDAQGVTLAAIQALNSKLAAREAETAELRRQNAALERRLAAIEERLDEH